MRQIITDVQTLRDLLPSWYGLDFAFDNETQGLNYRKHKLLGIALRFSDGRAYYIVHQHTVEREDGTTELGDFIPLPTLVNELRTIFSQREVVQVAHNMKFDMHFLHKESLFVEGRLFDTLLAGQLLDENRRNGLKELSSALLNFDYAKYDKLPRYPGFAKKDILGSPLADVADYAMNDVEATWQLYERFKVELANAEWKGRSLEDVFHEIWMPLLVVLQQMEERGIGLDLAYVEQLLSEYETKAGIALARVNAAGVRMMLTLYPDGQSAPPYYWRMATQEEIDNSYEDLEGQTVTDVDGIAFPIWQPTERSKHRTLQFNAGSDAQLYDLVYVYGDVVSKLPEHVNLTRTKVKQTYRTDKDNLETIAFYLGDDAPQYIRDALDWSKADKFIGTYLKPFLRDAERDNFNTIRTNFNMAEQEDADKGGTTTGRLSSSQPNLMNIPSRDEVGKAARKMFVARPGYTLVVADYSQMELRVLAHYADDTVLKEAFAKGQDLHIITGAAFAQMDPEELEIMYLNKDPKAKEIRQLGKTGNFALNYGMGPAKFQRSLLVGNKYEITLEEAKQWIENYNNMYLGSTEWKKKVWKFVGTHGYIVTLEGRFRRLPDAFSEVRWIRQRAERQGVNAIIQGSCGDIIQKVMIPIQQALLAFGGSLLLQVHDELVAEVPIQHAEICKEIMETIMQKYVHPSLTVPMVAEASYGPNWGDAKG